MKKNIIYEGKIRTLEDIDYGLLLFTTSNALSAFDRYICDIENKGIILNKISEWWFNNTKHIIENHFLYTEGQYMIVKRATPIKIEFVVRAYMTGSTNTSIWPMYKNGNRTMYGIQFRDGYIKNQKLDELILTPTTKDKHDEPITKETIIAYKYLTNDEYEFIKDIAIKLFTFGQGEAEKKGLILVDTKYEFGKIDNKIILIDELHTCDSSRYWLNKSYKERMKCQQEPEKMDKDSIRDWLSNCCDPYKIEKLPEIPQEIIKNVESVYNNYLNLFSDSIYSTQIYPCSEYQRDIILKNYFVHIHKKLVIILSGSNSDKLYVDNIIDSLLQEKIYSISYVASAHKNIKQVLDIINKYENTNKIICYVTIAGLSNALSGVVTCNTRFPVIASPNFKDNMDMFINIHSTLQMPSNVPVMTILKPINVALAIKKIFALSG